MKGAVRSHLQICQVVEPLKNPLRQRRQAVVVEPQVFHGCGAPEHTLG